MSCSLGKATSVRTTGPLRVEMIQAVINDIPEFLPLAETRNSKSYIDQIDYGRQYAYLYVPAVRSAPYVGVDLQTGRKRVSGVPGQLLS